MSTYLPETRGRLGSHKLVTIASLCLTLNLAGFLAVSYLPGALHIDHRVATVPFRCLVLLLSLYAVYKIFAVSHLRVAISVTTLLVTAFWIFYITRFLSDTVLFPVPIGENPDDMALFLFAISLPTFIVFYLFSEIALYRKALVWSMLALGACCAISMRSTNTEDATRQGQHMGNDILNHIGYGHMGLTAMILGLFVLLRIGRARRNWILRFLAAATVCFGAFTVLAAASRGALVASVCTASGRRLSRIAPWFPATHRWHLCCSVLCVLCGCGLPSPEWHGYQALAWDRWKPITPPVRACMSGKT